MSALPRVDQNLMAMDEIGIVVIGRNEGQRLIDCLASLANIKTGEPIIVYADSGSVDGSAEAAEKSGALVVKMDASYPFTAARARNEGFAALMATRPNCKYVQFVDGDCQLVSTWLDIAVPFISAHEDVAVVCGRRRESHPEASIYNRLCDIEWNSPIGLAWECGGDSLMRTDAFRSAGGFSASLIAGEEPELCARLRNKGWKIWRLAAEMTYHDAAMLRFRQWWRRAIRSGYAEAEVSSFPMSSVFKSREKRATISAILWAGLLPMAIILGAIFNPIFLLFGLLYFIQFVRIASAKSLVKTESCAYALFIMIGKFAQLQGILMYVLSQWRNKRQRLIEYK